MLRRYMLVLLAGLILCLPAATQAETIKDAMASIEANVIFLRHALAPGYGDPDNFDLRDCSTQRNLNEHGRQQAQMIGAYLKDQGIVFDAVLSSQWCRCRDTAEEMQIGPWSEFHGLNSFFEGHVDRRETLAALNGRMAAMNDGETILMVTHQVVIQAVARISPSSGGMVAYNSRNGKAVAIDLPAKLNAY